MIDHLLRKRIGGKGNSSQLQFEVGLRRYKDNLKFKAPKEWSNITITNSRNSPLNQCKTETGVKLDKEGSSNLRQSKFTDRYKEKNINVLRHLFKADQKVSNFIWEGGLRNHN